MNEPESCNARAPAGLTWSAAIQMDMLRMFARVNPIVAFRRAWELGFPYLALHEATSPALNHYARRRAVLSMPMFRGWRRVP